MYDAYILYLLDYDEQPLTLNDILQFITGLREIPPLGFPKGFAIYFIDNPDKVLPEVNACFYTLHLPLHFKSKELCARFNQAVLYSLNHFGQV